MNIQVSCVLRTPSGPLVTGPLAQGLIGAMQLRAVNADAPDLSHS